MTGRSSPVGEGIDGRWKGPILPVARTRALGRGEWAATPTPRHAGTSPSSTGRMDDPNPPPGYRSAWRRGTPDHLPGPPETRRYVPRPAQFPPRGPTPPTRCP